MVVDRRRQLERQNKWIKDNRARFSLDMTKEKHTALKEQAEKEGVSVNRLINNLIDNYLNGITSDQSNSGMKYYRD